MATIRAQTDGVAIADGLHQELLKLAGRSRKG
jgi:hypothetical protein